jgi:hypothetical protein
MYDLKMYKDQEPKMGSKFRNVNGDVVGHIQPVSIPGSVQKWGVVPANEKKKKSESK